MIMSCAQVSDGGCPDGLHPWLPDSLGDPELSKF